MAALSKSSSLSRSSPFRFLLENPISFGFRILFLVLLSCGIVVGALNQSYGISALAQSIGIDPDAILVVIGVVNKILDYILGDTIAHVASVSLTVWLATKTRFAGVGWHDFDLETEMSKPYISVYRFWQKWRSPDYKIGRWDLVRLLLTLASAMGVLLVGAMVNVLVIPKTIWLPGTTNGMLNITTMGAYFDVPTQYIAGIDWVLFNETRLQVPQGQILQSIKLSSSVVEAVAGVVPAVFNCSHPESYCQVESYFRIISNEELVNASTNQCSRGAAISVCDAPYTRFTWMQPLETRARTTSSSTQLGADFYTKTMASHAIATRSSCVRNWFYATLPIVESQCRIVTGPTTNANFSLTFEEAPSGGLVRTAFGSVNDGAQSFECNSTLAQYLYPMYLHGCSDVATQPWENWPNTQFYNASLLNTTSLNANILQSVAEKFSSLTPYLDGVSGGSFANLVIDAGSASVNNNQSSPGPRTQEVGTAFAVGTILSHLIALADWTVENSDDVHTTGPLQFLVYGSGPREEWQWVLVIVGGICIALMLYDIYLIAFKPGPAWWMNTPGLLLFANDSDKLGYPFDQKRIKKDRRTRLYARDRNGHPTLTLDSASGKTFQNPEKEIGSLTSSGVEMEDLENRRSTMAESRIISRQSTQPLLSEETKTAAVEQETEEDLANSSSRNTLLSTSIST